MKHGIPGQKADIFFFDVDAKSELCFIPSESGVTCPRIGEQVDYRAEMEQGGGLYIVINVRHVLQKGAAGSEAGVSVSRIVVDLKPIHSATTEQEDAVAIEISVEEFAALPTPPDVVPN